MSTAAGEGESLTNLIDLLEARAAAAPERPVYAFLDGDAEVGPLTCGALWRRAQAVAAALQRRHAAGERVLLLYPTGLDFIVAFFGCLLAGLVAVPAPPPDPARRRRTVPRLAAMARDAAPVLVLCDPAVRAGVGAILTDEPELAARPWRTLEEVAPADADAGGWSRPALAGDALAYLQYTSGSTAAPKGVMVSHGNVLHNARLIRHAWRYGPDSVALSWVPNFHDDGLVHGIVQPLYSGGRTYLMAPAAFVGRPVRWLQAVTRCRATHTGGPDFAYALAARKVRAEQRVGLDLSSWRLAYNAAEPVRRDTLAAFARAFGPCGFDPAAFFPSFGLAESTLLVTTGRWGEEPPVVELDPAALERDGRVVAGAGRTFVGCGAPVLDTEVAIVRPATGERAADAEVGEVWLRSPSVAQGYWRNAAATAETFGARLVGEADGGPYLRTGDLGFLRGGELFLTGRHKDLIILRGRNVAPQDLESSAVAAHPALRPGCAAAFGVELGGEERLALVCEVDDRAPLDAAAVAAAVRERLVDEHDVQLASLTLIRPRTIPKTSSGKIQRRACRTELLAGELEVVGRWEAAPAPADGGRVDELLAGVRSLAGRIDWRLIDERRSFPPHLVLELGNRGLLGLQAPVADGGLGLSHRELVRVLAQLGAIDLTLATFVTGHNALGLRPILRHAPPALRRELLPSLARGRELAAFALTEPGAGSDPRALAATAAPDGDGWRLAGWKVLSGSAGWAGVLNVFVHRLDGAGNRQGTAAFALRPAAAGVRIGAEAATMGLRGMSQNAVHLDGARAAAGELLGTAGDGLAVAEDAMRFTRFCLAAVCVGGAKRCAQLMVRYAARRTVATGRLLDNPVTLVRLTDLLCETAAVEALVASTAAALDRGEPVPEEAFAALKVAGPEMLWRAADSLTQLLGGRGYLENNVAPRILRDARVFRVFEGPTEALQAWLGAAVDRDPRALDDFLRRRLAAPAVADALGDAVAAVAARLTEAADDALADRVAVRRWLHALLGEVATAAVLWAAAASATSPAAGLSAERVAEWARRRFAETVARASAASPAEAVLCRADEAAAAVEAFAAEIGDQDPGQVGVEERLDPLLARAAPAAAETARPDQAAAPSALAPRPSAQAPPAAAGPGAATVERWLVDWFGRELGVAAAEVDVEQPFVSLGLDSVTAVALAEDFAAWLERPAERTLAWQYPSIAALARRFGGDVPAADRRGAPGPAVTAPSPSPPSPPASANLDDLLDLLRDVEGLSDEQAELALAAERTEVRR